MGRKLAVNGIGCIFTAAILVLTVSLKFNEGGWITVAITSAVVAACYLVRRDYELTAKAIEQLEADVAARDLPRCDSQTCPARSCRPHGRSVGQWF